MPLGNGILTVDTDAQAWARASIDRRRQGRRRGARRACADAALQALGLLEQMRPNERERRARPTGAARRASPPCRRSTRWISPARGSNEILAEFESHWIGQEVEGEQYLPAEAAFFRDLVGGVVREQRKLDPLIDEALAKRLAAQAHRGAWCAPCCAPAPMNSTIGTDVPARVVVSEYVDVAHAFVEREETGMVNAVLDQLARAVAAPTNSTRRRDRWRKARRSPDPAKTG